MIRRVYGNNLGMFGASCDTIWLKPWDLRMWYLVITCGDLRVSTILRHNLLQTFFKKIIASTCDVKVSHPFSWFSDSVRILYKSNLTQFGRHVACTRWWSFRICPWIRCRNTLGRMNIIYWIFEIHYFMHLQFKCASCEKNQENEKNTWNIARGMENTPNFKSWLLAL
jgi:hypothetical protein